MISALKVGRNARSGNVNYEESAIARLDNVTFTADSVRATQNIVSRKKVFLHYKQKYELK